MPTVSIISALASNRVIGIDNHLPWNLPADWENFRQVTAGKAFLMGRTSAEAQDALFSDYKTYILSRNPHVHLCSTCYRVASIEEFIEVNQEQDEIFILGGASVFEQALQRRLANKMYLTLVNAQPAGDAYFPEVDWNEWQEIESIYHPRDAHHAYDFYIKTYMRGRLNG